MLLAKKNYPHFLAGSGAPFTNRSSPAEIIRDARNPFARKIIINKGTAQGLSAGLGGVRGDGGGGPPAPGRVNYAGGEPAHPEDQARPGNGGGHSPRPPPGRAPRRGARP